LAVAGSIIIIILGVITSFLFQPLSDWWLGENTFTMGIIISIIYTILSFFMLSNDDTKLVHLVASLILVPIGVMISVNGILVSVNIIFGIIFSILGLRAFAWGISGLSPTEEEALAGAVFSGALTIGGVVVSIIAVILIVIVTYYLVLGATTAIEIITEKIRSS
jgi:hypothetical protein